MQTIQFIGISPEENKDSILKGVKKELEKFKENFEPKKPTEFLTRNEVSKLLKINLSTLSNWVKHKKLPCYSISGRVYFKRSEVESKLIRINP